MKHVKLRVSSIAVQASGLWWMTNWAHPTGFAKFTWLSLSHITGLIGNILWDLFFTLLGVTLNPDPINILPPNKKHTHHFWEFSWAPFGENTLSKKITPPQTIGHLLQKIVQFQSLCCRCYVSLAWTCKPTRLNIKHVLPLNFTNALYEHWFWGC